MADPNAWDTGMGITGNTSVPTADQWMQASATPKTTTTTTTPTAGSLMSTGDGASITGSQPAPAPTTPSTPQTWQELNDSIQKQYTDNLASLGWDANTGTDSQGAYHSADWTDPNLGQLNGITLPGQQGTWAWQPNATLPGGGQFVQENTPLANGNQYQAVSMGPNGTVQSGTKISPEDSGAWKAFGNFVADVLPIASWVATPFTLGAGAEALAGAGAAAADTGAAAGWVSAEGGAGYAGGMAADAGALGGAGAAMAPGVGGSASAPSTVNPSDLVTNTSSGASGTVGTGASGGAEPAGWTSAENGAGYSNGSVVDNAAGNIGGAPVTSTPVTNTGNIYTGNAALPTGYGTPSTLGNLYDKAATGLGNMTLGDYLKAGAGIGTAIKGYTNSQNTVANNAAYQQQINNMYAPGSPEYLALQQQMERQDAANGRNSQYGTRLAEMGAKIAQLKMQALTSPAYAGSVASTNQANSQDLNSLFALMGQAGNYIK